MPLAFDPQRSRPWASVTAIGVAGCFIAIIAMQVVGYVWLRGAFPEPAALTLLLVALALVAVWLRIQRRLAVHENRTAVRRMSKSELLASAPAARCLLRRRATATRGMLFLGTCSVFALVSGTLGDDPDWRAFVAADPEIHTVQITAIGEVEKTSGRRGPRFSYTFSGYIPTTTSIHLIEDRVSTDDDPRETGDWSRLVYAVYDPDDVRTGVVFARSYREAEDVTRFPLTPVFGLGGYGLVLLSAAAFSKSPSRWITEMSRSGLLPYYRGRVRPRPDRSDAVTIAFLGLIAMIVYLGCLLRLVPTSGFTDQLFSTASTGLFIYGLALHVFAMIIGTMLANRAIGSAIVARSS